MSKYFLKVKYRLRIHDMDRFEKILTTEVIPLAEDLGLNLSGVWRSFVGNVGEYLELWEFSSMEEFETDWKKLINHPKMQEIFKTTGPMVAEEAFSVYEPVWEK